MRAIVNGDAFVTFTRVVNVFFFSTGDLPQMPTVDELPTLASLRFLLLRWHMCARAHFVMAVGQILIRSVCSHMWSEASIALGVRAFVIGRCSTDFAAFSLCIP